MNINYNNMKTIKLILIAAMAGITSSAISQNSVETFSLTITVDGLRNSTGVVQYSLYNTEGCFPDEHYEKQIKQMNTKIVNNSSTAAFENLPKGMYAVNILHDEDENSKIKKGWILPKEGIGFSNLKSINPLNRPSFKKCKFELVSDKSMQIKIIYM